MAQRWTLADTSKAFEVAFLQAGEFVPHSKRRVLWTSSLIHSIAIKQNSVLCSGRSKLHYNSGVYWASLYFSMAY